MASNNLPLAAMMRAVKREAPDDDDDDDETLPSSIAQTPAKRRAVPSRDTPDPGQISEVFGWLENPHYFTKDELRGRPSEELIEIILMIQESYLQRSVRMGTRLQEFQDALASDFSAHNEALEAMRKILVPEVAMRPDTPQNHIPQPYRRPHPTISDSPRQSFRSASVTSVGNGSQRGAHSASVPAPPVVLPTPSPASRFEHALRAELAPSPSSSSFSMPGSATAASSFSAINQNPPSSTQPALPAVTQPTGDGPPTVECTAFNTVKEIWQEYRYGIPEQPAAIETLDATWGPRWRPEAKIRTWYSRRKLIYDKVKELMADGIDEATAVREVEAMRRGRTINWLMRLLQEDRKETRASWKAAAAAATAAAQVVHARPSQDAPSPAPPRRASFQHTSF